MQPDFIYDDKEHTDFFVQIHTLTWNQSCRVVELMNDCLTDFFGIIRNNFKTDCAAAVFGQTLRNSGRGERIENTKYHRLDFISINKVGSNCHHSIHGENQIKNTFFRMILMDNRCYKIGAAGIGTGLQQ